MHCVIKPLEFADEFELSSLQRLCHEGRDFHDKLISRTLDGIISMVFDEASLIGWARTERWFESEHQHWDTLEAFVHPAHRGSGVASFAAAGLRASESTDTTMVAVFHPTMLMVAKSAGFFPTLFSRSEDGSWTSA